MAGFISPQSIEAVNNTADIVSVVGDYVKLDRKGSEYWGCCPFHHEKSPSFHVIPEKNIYYCFGCHAGGGVIKFVQEIEKITFPEAVNLLASKFGIRLTYENSGKADFKVDKTKDDLIELYSRCSNMFNYFLTQTDMGKPALEYIKKRGLTEETIEKFKLGYSPADRFWLKKFLLSKNYSEDFLAVSGLFSKNYKNISFFNDRFMIPIFDDRGQCIAMSGRILHPQGENDRKYLNSPELPQYSKKKTLFALHLAKRSIAEKCAAIVCEGPMDCIAYHQCGISYAVATCGTALTDEHIQKIKRLAYDKKTGDSTIILSFDSDSAGQNATIKAILACRKAGLTVKIIQLRGGKDPAEIMLNYGPQTLTEDVDCAKLDSDYLFDVLAHKYPVDTADGKKRASFEFFAYVDALQTEIQKESSLEQFCQKFNISLQSVQKDFQNRKQSSTENQIRPEPKASQVQQNIKITAELKALLAVIANTDQFELMRRELNEELFEDPVAKDLFIVLEECYQNGTLYSNAILEKCHNESLGNLILKTLVSNEYSKETAENVVADSIALIKKNHLKRQREYILGRLSGAANADERDMLLSELMDIDQQIRN